MIPSSIIDDSTVILKEIRILEELSRNGDMEKWSPEECTEHEARKQELYNKLGENTANMKQHILEDLISVKISENSILFENSENFDSVKMACFTNEDYAKFISKKISEFFNIF